MSKEDYYEGRIASLRTGIKLVLHSLEPSLLSDAQKVELAQLSLNTLLNSDLDKGLQGDHYESPTDDTAGPRLGSETDAVE